MSNKWKRIDAIGGHLAMEVPVSWLTFVSSGSLGVLLPSIAAARREM